MPHRKNFEASIKTLNSQLWVLMTLCEHSAGQFSQMPSLDGLPHQNVIPAIFNHSKSHAARIRLRNDSLCADMIDLTKTTEKWLPAYFLVLAKSILEGMLNDYLTDLYTSDSQMKTKIDIKRKGKSKVKQIELIAQAIARGSFAEFSDVIDITLKLQNHAAMSTSLNTYSTIRNKMAHNLNGQYATRRPITVEELKDYINNIQQVVESLI